MQRNKILKQWDKAVKYGEFPHMGSDYHWIYGKSRLVTFRLEREWLTIFEMIVLYPGLDDYIILVYAFGNKIKKPGLLNWDMYSNRIPGEKTIYKSAGLKNPAIRNNLYRQVGESVTIPEEWDPNPLDFHISVNGVFKEFKFSKNEYKEIGIDINYELTGNLILDHRTYCMRMLCEKLSPEEIFLPKEFYLVIFEKDLNKDLFLQLFDWSHPGLTYNLPSESECLRLLAQALAENDRDIYHCRQTILNTHWSNWPTNF